VKVKLRDILMAMYFRELGQVIVIINLGISLGWESE
jgi:hypothetical protein